MNEFHRQMYLSVIGVDTYMPRLHLPFAPTSIACEIQPLIVDEIPLAYKTLENSSPIQVSKPVDSASPTTSPVGNLIGEIFEIPKISRPVLQPVTAADILAHLDSKPATVEPFSLSIWRPLEGLMIVDSRNTKLALPTELFLQNILRSVFTSNALTKEEVLRWPAIENSFTQRSAADARNELQTWLSVQHEIRPIQYLLLMGSNAATYLLPEDTIYSENLYSSISLLDSSVRALILPSLNELLQKPATKKQLQSALHKYLVASA